jgi:hypothetical protein
MSLAGTEPTSCASNEEVQAAMSVKQGGRKEEEPMRAEGAEFTRHFLQVPLQVLVLGLAGAVLRQQLLEDICPKLVDTLKEQRNDLSVNRD